MKTTLVFAALLLSATQALAQALPPDLAKAAKEYDEAQVNGDQAALMRLLADDYVLVNSLGQVENKAQLIADYTTPGFKLDPFVVRDLIEKVWGNAAVLGGVVDLSWTAGGKPDGRTLRFADVWAKRQGRWQVTFTEVTRVAN